MTFLRRSRSASPPAFREAPPNGFFGGRSKSCCASMYLPHVVSSPPHSPQSTPRKRLDLVARPSAANKATFAVFSLVLCGVGIHGRFASLRRDLDLVVEERDGLAATRDQVLEQLRHVSDDNGRTLADNAWLQSEKMRLEEERVRLERAKAAESLSLRGEEELRRQELARAEEAAAAAKAKLEKAQAEAQETIGDLKRKIQAQSRREVTDKFGPSPYRVEFELELPLGVDKTETKFMTVETAPLDLMPHSVNLFLQQVSRGIWDGTEIFKNRKHILLARDFDHETGRDKMPDLNSMKVAKLAFREHTDEYPHDKYTLGFAGRPGGPNFYFNKMDNHEWHGPGPNDGDEGDPCFAIIVEGMDLVDLMGDLPTNKEDGLLHRRVVIRKATIFTKATNGKLERWSRKESQQMRVAHL